MKKLLIVAFAAVVMFSTSIFAAETEESTVYAEIGAWEIRVDNTVSISCFMWAVYDGGTIFRLQMSEASKLFIWIGNTNWSSIVEDQEYDISLSYDDKEPIPTTATGSYLGEMPTVFFTIDITSGVENISKSNNIKLRVNGKVADSLSLKGTKLALDSVIKCLRELYADKKNADPFEGLGKKSSTYDPFEKEI